MKRNTISKNVRFTIGCADFAYAFAEMLSEQSKETEIISMADSLSKSALAALSVLPSQEVRKRKDYLTEILNRAEKMMNTCLSNKQVHGASLSAFLIALFEKLLYIPHDKTGQPKKNGWIKDSQIRDALQDIIDILQGLMTQFDSEYELTDELDQGIKAFQIYLKS